MTKHCGANTRTGLLVRCELPRTAEGRGDKPRDYKGWSGDGRLTQQRGGARRLIPAISAVV
jgi:hypothetical protein